MSRKVDELLKLAMKFEHKIALEQEVIRSKPKLQVWLQSDKTKAQAAAMANRKKFYYTFAPDGSVIGMIFGKSSNPGSPKNGAWYVNDAPPKQWDYATMEVVGHPGIEVMHAPPTTFPKK